jgi:hypothetical protein
LVPGTQRKKKTNGDQEGCRLDLIRLLMRVDNSAGNGTSRMNKFDSVIDRMNTELGNKFLNS